MELKGICTRAAKRKAGSNAKGEWSIQYIDVKDNNGTHTVCVWNRADLASAEGKAISITGLEDGSDKSGKPCFVLQSGEGSIETREINRTTQQSAQKNVASGKISRPTQTEYEAILVRAINFVYREFSKHANVEPQAVAHVVNGYMVAYSKGDFLVETTVSEKNPPAELDEDIPF